MTVSQSKALVHIAYIRLKVVAQQLIMGGLNPTFQVKNDRLSIIQFKQVSTMFYYI